MNKFNVKLNRRNVSEKELIDDLIRVAKKLGQDSLARPEYETYGLYSYTTIRRRFQSWYTALEKAGLKSSQRKINNPVEELLKNIADVWTTLGKQPTYTDMNQLPSVFTAGTYEKRFGSWNKALLQFAEFIESGQLPDEVPQERSNYSKTKRTPRRINWRLRASTLIKDSCICRMCGASPSKDAAVKLHVDHIKPWSKGGETIPDNLQTLCSKCNIGKSDMH